MENDIKKRRKDWKSGDEVLGINTWMVVKTGERLKGLTKFNISRRKGTGIHCVLEIIKLRYRRKRRRSKEIKNNNQKLGS